MSGYKTEGYIKTIKVAGSGVTFTIDAAEPYVFESKDNKEAVPTRKILLVADAGGEAKIVVADSEFKIGNKKAAKFDCTALLIAKANRMKVRLTVVCDDDKTEKMAQPLIVSKLDVL